MRILAFSDLHGDLAACDAIVAAAGSADLVLGAGDFTSAHQGDEAAAALAPFKHADILLTHSPPRGIADVFGSLGSIGSRALRAAVERLQPRLMLFGHMHDGWGQEGRIGLTRCRNLGPGLTWLKLETRRG